MNDSDLVTRCQSGDVRAFEILVEEYSDKAVRTAYLITGRKEIAEDIAQEAFIQCYYSIARLKNAALFNTWFYKILLRTSWKMGATARGKLQVDYLDDGAIKENLPDRYDLAEAFERRQDCEAVYRAVGTLGQHLKAVVVLHYFNGFPIKEIAQVLGCREGTVKSRLHNARKQLAENLKQKGRDVANQDDYQATKECDSNARTITV